MASNDQTAVPEDNWDGEEYLAMEGVIPTGKLNAETVVRALGAAGYSPGQIKTLNILEVGAGVGTVTPVLAAAANSVHAVEPSRSQAAVLARQIAALPNVTFAVHELTPASGESFAAGKPEPAPTAEDPGRMQPAPYARFDVAASTLVMHHVSDLDSYFAGIRSVLKPGGTLVVVEFALRDGEDVSVKYHLEHEADQTVVTDNDKPLIGKAFRASWTDEQLRDTFTHHGFTDVHTISGGLVPGFKHLGKEDVPTVVVYGRAPAA